MDKITIERETLQAALKALDKCARTLDEFPAWSVAGHEASLAHQSIANLRAALAAQPAEPVEPVAWLRFQEHADRPTTVHLCDSDHPRAFQVYAAQPAPAAVPLTDEQIDALMSAANLSIVPEGWTVDAWVVHRVARAVERAHGIAAARDKP